MNIFSGSKVLITGGLGFIGSNLAYSLVNYGADVTLVDSLIPNYGGNLFNIYGIEDKVRINYSDVRDQYSMNHLIKDKDILFNLAGQTSHIDSMQDPYTDLDINCRSQLSILEGCRCYNPDIRVVFASTRQMYGRPDFLPVNEKHPLRPVDVNGINKMAGEWYHILYNNVYGIRSCALRLTNTYGPRMRIKDARQTFVGVWIRQLLEGGAIDVWGGDQLRDFTYVDDVVQAMLLCVINNDTWGRVFNLGGESVVSLRQLAELLIDINGQGCYKLKEYPPERMKIDIGDYYSDFDLISKVTGWQPTVTLAEGLTQTLDFFRSHKAHYI